MNTVSITEGWARKLYHKCFRATKHRRQNSDIWWLEDMMGAVNSTVPDEAKMPLPRHFGITEDSVLIPCE